MKFQYDINALRAIAVVGVLFFHFKVPYFEGGFSGVDIFYVISGYLMTRIIITGLAGGQFSIADFYLKRAQRIIPALLVLIVVLLAVCFFVYLPNDYQNISRNALASIAFLSNILYWKNSGYFDTSSETNALLHTWSLSVEWQFYLLLPLALVILNRFVKNNNRRYLWLFAVSTAIIFAGSVFVSLKNPSLSFYVLPTRSWEMMMGGVAYLSGDLKSGTVKKWVALAGYLCLLICLVTLKSQMTWPGPYTLIPVVATYLIIIANYKDFGFLKTQVIQMAGKISYSMYLWHWPLFVVGAYLGMKLNAPVILALLCTSTILAWLSYRYVESVHLTGKALTISSLTMATITGLIIFKPVNSVLFRDETIEIADYWDTHQAERKIQFATDSCYIYDKHRGLVDYDKVNCLDIDPERKNILLIGDSHAAHLSQSIREMLSMQGIHMGQASASGCFPLLKKNGANRCMEVIDYVYKDFIPKNAKNISGIILSANWTNAPEKEYPELAADLKNTIDYLTKLHIKVVVIGQNEVYSLPYPSISAREFQFSKQISDDYLKPESESVNQYLASKLPEQYINIFRADAVPKLSKDRVPYMFDENHFTKYGADGIAGMLVKDPKFQQFIH